MSHPFKQPLGNRVFFTLPEVEETTEGGIILSEDAMAERAAQMEKDGMRVIAIACGPDCEIVKVGDELLLDAHHVPVFSLNKKRYSCVYEHNIGSVLEPNTTFDTGAEPDEKDITA